VPAADGHHPRPARGFPDAATHHAHAQLARAFEHRFDSGGLDGHALGNLVIAALVATTGDFVTALKEAGRVIGARGTVLPATDMPVVLKADSAHGPVHGQVNVSSTGRIAHVTLVPSDAPAAPGVVEAIERADQIVMGPGSLFTSVLAALIVNDVKAAITKSTAQKVYVCNLRPQEPETAGYDVAAHVEALVAHGIDPDVVVYDAKALPAGQPGQPGQPGAHGGQRLRAIEADLTGTGPGHDPAKLAKALADLVG
jgi:uncharacterized cofD-like protein